MLPAVRRCLLPVLMASLLLGSCLVSSAAADGGPSIAAAPLVAYGQQEFGNTATGGINNPQCTYSSNWLLPVTAGDQITIDWEIQAARTWLLVYPLGTSDFNVGAAQPLQQQDVIDNGKDELVFSASASGNLPLVFQTDGPLPACPGDPNDAGPYDFTASVRHVVRLALPRVFKLTRTATLKVAAHNAEGGSITDPNLTVEVQLKTGKSWNSVGRAAVANATATIPLKIPQHDAGKVVSLRAIAHGGSYLSAATSSRRVLITSPPPKKKVKAKRRRSNRRAVAADVTPWGYQYDPDALAQQCVDSVLGRNSGSGATASSASTLAGVQTTQRSPSGDGLRPALRCRSTRCFPAWYRQKEMHFPVRLRRARPSRLA